MELTNRVKMTMHVNGLDSFVTRIHSLIIEHAGAVNGIFFMGKENVDETIHVVIREVKVLRFRRSFNLQRKSVSSPRSTHTQQSWCLVVVMLGYKNDILDIVIQCTQFFLVWTL